MTHHRPRARELAHASIAQGDPTGWFERLYVEAREGTTGVPWDDRAPNPMVVRWLDAHRAELTGTRALDVGCGLGDNAEELARRGFDVTAFDVAPTAVAGARERFPTSVVRHEVADLLAPPERYLRAFDLVTETYTLQALPADVRAVAMASLRSLVAAARDGNLFLLTDDFVRRPPSTDIFGLPYTVVKVSGESYRIRTAVSPLALAQPILIPAGTTYTAVSKRLSDVGERSAVVAVRLPGAPNIPQLPDTASTAAQLLRAQIVVAGMHPHLSKPWKVVSLSSDGRDTDSMRLTTALKQVAVALADGHAQVLYRPMSDAGIVPAPVRLRVLDGQLTIVQRYGIPPLEAGLELGDVIETINGEPWSKAAKPLAAELSFSTQWAHTLYVCNRILAGPSGGLIRIGINRGGKRKVIELLRVMTVAADGRIHERLTPPARMLAGSVGYLDLDSLTPGGLGKALAVVGNAEKWIIDARGQGNMVAWDLAPQLATKRTVAGVCVTRVDCADVGASQETQQRRRELVIEPAKGARRRKVVVLVDERTQSQSEVSAMFFKAVGALIVGSRTAGTVGDVTDIQAHPEVRISFSGQDVLTPQGLSLHGRGLDIDVQVRETPAAVRSGRDLPLEAALRLLKG